MVSVICPIYNEERYIDGCIGSILAQDYPKEDMEVIFADGCSRDNTRLIVADYASRYPWIRLIDNPDRYVPHALNKAIRESHGDIIIRIDAHAKYPADYISTLSRALERYGADNVGVVCRTDVKRKTARSEAIITVLSHPLGVGNATFRTGVSEPREVDTVPFGCWRREVFDRYGYFDTRLTRNQDIEMNKRILRGGGRIILIPDTHCTYYARESFGKLAENNYDNGKWNILTVWYTRQFDSLSLRHFIPLIFVMSLVLPLVAGIFWRPLAWLSVASAVCYLMAISTISARLAIKRHLNWAYLVTTFITLHISYGIGSLVGLMQLPFIKR